MLKKINKFLSLFERDKNLQELTESLIVKKLKEDLKNKEEIIIKLQNKIVFLQEIQKAEKSFEQSLSYFRKNNNERKLLLYSSLESINSKIKQATDSNIRKELNKEKGILLSKIKSINILDNLIKDKFILSLLRAKINESNNQEMIKIAREASFFYIDSDNYFKEDVTR